MRIVLDARKLADFGIGRYVSALLDGLPARAEPQHQLMACCHPHQRDMLADRYPGWILIETAARGYSLHEQIALPHLLRRHRACLLHAPHYNAPWYAPCPTVVTVHDCIHLRFPEFLPSPLARLYARTTMAQSVRRAATVLTVSKSVRAELIQRFGIEEPRVEVTPNGVSVPPPPDSAIDLGAFGIDRPFMLYVGNVKPHKNLPRLLRAFSAVNDAGVQLVLAGGRLPSTLRHSVEDKRVIELGFVAETLLWTLYRRARLLVLVSLEEGFGLPALEAMAVGTPVLASRVGGLRELGDAPLLVDPLDEQAIAEGMRTLLADDEQRQGRGAAGLEVASRYRWRHTVDATYAAYCRALGGTQA